MAARDCCSSETPIDLEQSLVVEREHAEHFLAEAVVPGVEVHHDRDVTWLVHAGQAWRNAGIMVRFSPSSAARRLDQLLARYRRHGRGIALWISPSATPPHLTELLTERRLRCRKHFPAMVRRLSDRVPRLKPTTGLTIRRVDDITEFEDTPHPAIGRVTTPLRRVAYERLRALIADPRGRTRDYVAWLDGTPVGAIEIFLGSASAGIHGLTVLERFQRRGIASALIEHACDDLRKLDIPTLGLLATTEGQRLYVQRGFREVARFSYWYRSFQRKLRAS